MATRLAKREGNRMVIILTGLLGFLMAFAIGANDVANSMATAVGAKAITAKQAALIAMFMEFVGAIMFGSHVSQTIIKGIIQPQKLSPQELMYGSLAALLASTVWILLATGWGYPISTTHSIVGGMLGFGLVELGFQGVNWRSLSMIVLSWIISPLLGGLLAFVIFKTMTFSVFHTKDPKKSSKVFVPIFIGLAVFTMITLFLWRTVKLDVSLALLWGTISAVASALFSLSVMKNYMRRNHDEYETVENFFKKAQVLTSCYVALSHGANDVANAAGPFAAVLIIASTGSIPKTVQIPRLALFLGGLGISLGVLAGKRVIEMVGERITTLTNTRGFTVDFSTATTVLLASALGMPISTTHVVVGAVAGVGFARGLEMVNVGILKNIVISWFLVVPTVAASSAGVYYVLKLVLKF